jgi:hypothetical protein
MSHVCDLASDRQHGGEVGGAVFIEGWPEVTFAFSVNRRATRARLRSAPWKRP